MTRVLAIDTSTSRANVALLEGDGSAVDTVVETAAPMAGSHATHLFDLIDLVLAQAGWSKQQLGAVAVGRGPGSFTRGRIAPRASQGLALGAGRPCAGVYTPEAVGADALAREREILADQARGSGKPEEIVQKMVEGRLRKFYEEVALSEQTYVIDGETKVSRVIEAAAEEIGTDVRVAGFVRFALGEGIEKKEEDFAAEVAATLQG